MKKEFKHFEEVIGVKFKNIKLLENAFIHRSYINENGKTGLEHNERLEFLGDAVLELSATDYLFHKFKNKTEGELTWLYKEYGFSYFSQCRALWLQD